MDALTFLKRQHREVENLLHKAREASQPTERLNLFKQIDRDLRIHAIVEEEIFYRELRGRLDKGDERLEVAQAYEEHLLVKTTIESLEKLDPGTEQYQAKLAVLTELVAHHVDEEESTMFKLAHRVFEKSELEELGSRLQEAASQAALPV